MKITIKVGAILTNQKGDVLLIKEKYSEGAAYKWNIVKGTHDNFSETIDECVKREVYEEVGLNIKETVLKRVYSYGNEENRRFLFIFFSKIDENDAQFVFKNSMPDESIIDAKWFSKIELSDLSPKDCMDSYVYKSFDLVNNKSDKVSFINL